MKFKTLATAIAAATVSTATLAGGSAMADGHMGAPEFKISGDVTVGYFENGDDASFGANGSEVIFNAEQKVGAITYFGSMTANFADSQIGGGDISTDDLYVGFKGAFGEVRMGDTDNGCDAVDTGWVVDDEFISHQSGGCKAEDQNNVTYMGSRGPVSYAISYSPEVNNYDADEDEWSNDGGAYDGDDVIAMGIKGKVGPAAVSLGYESDAAKYGASGENVVLGVSGSFGPVAVGVRANKFENENPANGEDTFVGYTAQYSAGGNKFYIGYGDVTYTDSTTGLSTDDSLFLGYQRAIGSNTRFIAEYVSNDANEGDLYGIALSHGF